MNLSDAIDFWVTESGYRRIQNYLSRQAHAGASKYALANAVNTTTSTAPNVSDAIETLRDAMKPAAKTEIYYRGSPSGITNTHRREGFFSVAKTKEKAAAYGTPYTVRVDADVPRLSFAAEGGEVLLADGLVYEYPSPGVIHVRRPTSAVDGSIPFLGNLSVRRKTVAASKGVADLKYIVGRLYCYSLSPPDEVMGYLETTACDPEVLRDFEEKPPAAQITALKERLTGLKKDGHLDTFKEDIPLAFPTEMKGKVAEVIETTLASNHVGGRRRRQTRRKLKQRRK